MMVWVYVIRWIEYMKTIFADFLRLKTGRFPTGWRQIQPEKTVRDDSEEKLF